MFGQFTVCAINLTSFFIPDPTQISLCLPSLLPLPPPPSPGGGNVNRIMMLVGGMGVGGNYKFEVWNILRLLDGE